MVGRKGMEHQGTKENNEKQGKCDAKKERKRQHINPTHVHFLLCVQLHIFRFKRVICVCQPWIFGRVRSNDCCIAMLLTFATLCALCAFFACNNFFPAFHIPSLCKLLLRPPPPSLSISIRLYVILSLSLGRPIHFGHLFFAPFIHSLALVLPCNDCQQDIRLRRITESYGSAT